MNTSAPPLYRLAEPIVGMIWAQTNNGIIGADGGMPWKLPEDMAHFKNVTTGHPVVMGRRTWESFPEKFRPLPERTNIVLTRQPGWGESGEAAGATAVSTIEQAMVEAALCPGGGEIWVIGGGQVYAQAMDHCNVAVITIINTDVAGDTQAPDLGDDWTFRSATPAEGWLTAKNGSEYRITVWAKGNAKFELSH